jgi:hypothetical protein
MDTPLNWGRDESLEEISSTECIFSPLFTAGQITNTLLPFSISLLQCQKSLAMFSLSPSSIKTVLAGACSFLGSSQPSLSAQRCAGALLDVRHHGKSELQTGLAQRDG